MRRQARHGRSLRRGLDPALSTAVWLLGVIALAGCATPGADAPDNAGPDGGPEAAFDTRVTLERVVSFAAGGPSVLEAGPGGLEVEPAGDTFLRLIPAQGAALVVEATPISHDQSLPGPQALSIRSGDDQHRVLFLLPDGTGLEAVGSYSGVQERGAVSRLSDRRLRDERSIEGKARKPRGSPARSLTLSGRSFGRQHDEWGQRRALSYFDQAIARDERYAPAHAGRADAHASLFLHVRPDRAGLTAARKSARRAVELAPDSSEARASRGWIHNIDSEIGAAERELALAVKLDPRNAVARQWYAETLMKAGKVDPALGEIRRAVALAPRSATTNGIAGRLHQVARRYPEAIRYLETSLSLNPDQPAFLRLSLSYSYWAEGRSLEAVDAALRDPGLPAPARAQLRQVGRNRGLRALVELLYGAQVTESGRPCTVVPSIGATMLAFLGKLDDSLDCLEASLSEGVLPSYYELDPILDPIRASPRFAQIVGRRPKR